MKQSRKITWLRTSGADVLAVPISKSILPSRKGATSLSGLGAKRSQTRGASLVTAATNAAAKSATNPIGPDCERLLQKSRVQIIRSRRKEALATLPVSMPDEAALELQRCVRALGFKGAMLSGRVGDRNVDHHDFHPLFESAGGAQGTDLASSAHAGPGRAIRPLFRFHARGGWRLRLVRPRLHYDAGIQFIRLVLAGTFDRLPSLRVILGHWGEVVLFYAERLAATDRVSGLENTVATDLRRNPYVTASGMFSPRYLARGAAIVGAGRILFSTDFPYQYRPGGDARRFLAECGLDEAGKAGFADINWLRLTTATAN